MLLFGDAPVPRNPETASKSMLRRILMLRFGGAIFGEIDGGKEDATLSIIDEVNEEEVVGGAISSFFHTTRPSMPPSTLIHSPVICPAARWLARNAMVRATSSGLAIFRRGTVACASVQSSLGSSSLPSIKGVSTPIHD